VREPVAAAAFSRRPVKKQGRSIFAAQFRGYDAAFATKVAVAHPPRPRTCEAVPRPEPKPSSLRSTILPSLPPSPSRPRPRSHPRFIRANSLDRGAGRNLWIRDREPPARGAPLRALLVKLPGPRRIVKSTPEVTQLKVK
jgi:hypothetical protein